MAEEYIEPKVPKRILNTLLTSLTAGVVPRVGAPYIAIGRREEISSLLDNLDEVKEAIAAGADIIMLDNMGNEAMAEAVAVIKAADKGIKTEASGNMSIPRLIEVAATGVDYISVGALTHTVKAMDISMNIQVEK